MRCMDDANEHRVTHGPAHDDRAPGCFRGSKAWIGLIVLGAVAAFFLLAEHRAHLFGVLPYLLLLACPLMHLFMHRGHGGHGGDGHTPPTGPGDRS